MANSLKIFAFSLGCVLSWIIVMPLIVIGGGGLLFIYAALAELMSMLTGSAQQSPDAASARKTARSIYKGA